MEVFCVSSTERKYKSRFTNKALIGSNDEFESSWTTSRAAMSNQRRSGKFCAAQFRFQLLLTTSPYFDNLEFDIFVAGGPQCHFITSVTIAVRI